MDRCLAGDIGGTNARYGLVEKDSVSGAYRVSQVRILATADYDSVEQSLDAYLAQMKGPRPERACLAVAGPVISDRIKLTNLHWEFSFREVKDRFNFTEFKLANDFAAFLAGVTVLNSDDLRQVKSGVRCMGSTIAAIGPGTGLGIASMIRGADSCYLMAGEGGHATFAPCNHQELELARVLMKRFGRVSLEQVLSGPGLVNLYEALCAIEDRPASPRTPEQISGMGLSGEDPVCEETLHVFCRILGGVAGDLALTSGARGGVYIGGGVVHKFETVLLNGEFAHRFADKGPMSDYVDRIPVYVVHGGHCALLGGAVLLDAGRPQQPGGDQCKSPVTTVEFNELA
jgi:glucokinase